MDHLTVLESYIEVNLFEAIKYQIFFILIAFVFGSIVE
jgi:hypothetical protein